MIKLSSIARHPQQLDPRCLYSIEPDLADLAERISTCTFLTLPQTIRFNDRTQDPRVGIPEYLEVGNGELLSAVRRRCRQLDPRCLYSIEPDRADLSEYNNRTP